MKQQFFLGLVLSSSPAFAMAADRYTEARVTQIETSDFGSYVYLQVVSGDAPRVGNGGSNEPVSKPYLILSASQQDSDARRPMIASAFVALNSGAVVRFRWDDTNSRITHLLVRAP